MPKATHTRPLLAAEYIAELELLVVNPSRYGRPNIYNYTNLSRER